MIRANDVLGIIHSGAYDGTLPQLTNARTMGSVPFGGRYRLIDFALSNMVNAGIGKVGVITRSNYQSLMDHLGTGKPWDLSRKHSGMYILPPFASGEAGVIRNRMEAIKNNMHFIGRSKEEYVLMCDCNVIMNFSVQNLIAFHEKTGADISIISNRGRVPNLPNIMTFDVAEDGRVKEIAIGSTDIEGDYSLNVMFMKKALLEQLMNDAGAMKKQSFEGDVLQANANNLKIFAMQSEEFSVSVDSLASYYNANMLLLDPERSRGLFNMERPIYTKVRDDMPALYGINSAVKNSLVSDGCRIYGEVYNCILARGVVIEKGAVVRNSVIMQDSFIGYKAHIENVILDKKVTIKPNKTLCGAEGFPVYVGKGIVI